MTRRLACSLVAAVAIGCMGTSGPTVSPHVSAAQQSSASASMGLSFPPETRFLLYHRASEKPGLVPGPDDTVHLKIELPSAVAAKRPLTSIAIIAALATVTICTSVNAATGMRWPKRDSSSTCVA